MCFRVSSPSVNNVYDSLKVKQNQTIVKNPQEEKVIETSKKDTRVETKEKEGKVSGAGIDFVEEKTPNENLDSIGNPSAKRTVGVVYKAVAEKAVNATSNTLIKGVSVGIPFTNKSIGFGVQHAVAKELAQDLSEIAKANVKKGNSTIINGTKNATKTATTRVLDGLSKNGIGKGVETLTMKEASKEAGGVIKAVTNSYRELKANVSAAKVAQNISEETLPKLTKTTISSVISKEMTEATANFAKTGTFNTIAITDDFVRNTFSTLVTKEVEKIASKKGIEISKDAIKSFIQTEVTPLYAKSGEMLAEKGIVAGSRKQLTKKGFEKIITELGGESTKLASKTAEKIVQNAIAKNSTKTMLGISKEIFTGAGEKAIKKGLTEGIETGVQKAIKRAGSEVSEKLASESSLKMIEKSMVFSANRAKYSTSATIGTGIAKYGTAVGHIANGAILAYDGYDAYKKIKDPNVSMTSKALAATTVGLDVASMALDKKYKPLSWVASGLGIATSIGSDLTKDKN